MFKEQSVILFQGDSITDGAHDLRDRNHDIGHSFVYLIAAELGLEYAEQNLTFHNRGVSGNKITNIYSRWNADCLSLKPDILNILVGINDRIDPENPDCSGTPNNRYEQIYCMMLEDARALNSNLQIILCEPFFLRLPHMAANSGDDVIIKQQVVRRVAEKFDAIFVPLQKTFDDALKRNSAEYWLWDGIHPTPAGHQLMANQWLRCVKEKIK